MRIERIKNTKRNIVVGEIDKVVSILLPFVVRTLMLHLLGANYLGLTSLFYSIMQMLNLTEMGFGTAIVYSMYKPIADDNTPLINALLGYYKKIYQIVGVAIAVIGLLLLPFLPMLTRNEAPADVNVYAVYFIFLVNSCLNCFFYPNRRALLSAYQREDVSAGVHIISQTVLYVLQIISIILAKSYYLYVLTIPATTVLYSLLCARRAKKMFGFLREEGELDEEVHDNIKKQVMGLVLRKLAIYSRNAFDSIFISAFLGLEIVAVYGNYYYIMDSVVMILAVVKMSMAGGVGNSIAMESVDKNLKDMNTINFLFMIIGGWCTTCLLCLYQPFMRLWAGDDLCLPMYMVVLFSVYFYVLKMSDIRTLYSESVGLWWQGRYLSVIEIVANLSLNFLLIKYMGLVGIILATLISYFLFNFIGGAVILYKHYFKEKKIASYFLTHFCYLIVTAIVAGVTYFGLSHIKIDGILELIVKAVFCALVPGILYAVIYFKTNTFKDALYLVKEMFRNKSED